MKTKLLLIALTITCYGYSQHGGITTGSGYYINKIMASPSGSDQTKELIEIRGPVNGAIPADMYFITVEGDGNSSSLGQVEEAIQLSGAAGQATTFGANGILVVHTSYTDDLAPDLGLFTPSAFTGLIDAQASVIEIAITGNDVSSSSSSTFTSAAPSIGWDGNLIDQSGTYMLITASANPKDVYIDGPNSGDGIAADGQIDSAGTHITDWTLYDSVTYMDDNDEGQNEYGYGQIIFAQHNSDAATGAAQFTEADANVYDFSDITNASDVNIMMRQGMDTGHTIDDWVAAATSNNGNPPNWTFSTTAGKTLPAIFEGYADLNTTYGALNTTQEVLSSNDFSISDFRIYPNPANDFITIESNTVQISSVNVYDVLGKNVLSQNELANNRLDVSNFDSGIYFVKISSEDASITKKIIIQ